jgi:fructokinase
MRIGIDLGGTKIEAIALDDAGTTLLRRRVPTPAGDYTQTLSTVADLVATAERELGQQGTVGVAAPGSISTRSGLVKNSNSTILNGKPLDRDLSNRLGRPIRLENDANCFALSEAVDGAGANGDLVFGVILGTGVGGGLVIGRKPIVGHNRIAGEWGHNPALAPRQRATWPHLLLRKAGLHRDVPMRRSSLSRLSLSRRQGLDCRGDRTCGR